jgi:GT2 family glycosyltransferase
LGWKLAEIGEIGSPGGGGLFRASVLREAGGYDDSLFGAEEIDLGYRLRHRYFKIIRLPHLMARHDMGMKSFGQFWRRSVRDGYWEMAMILRYFNWSWPPPQDYIWKMNLQLIAFFTLLAMLVCRPHPILGALALGLPAIFLLKKTRHFYRVTGERKMSWLAALFNYLNMFPLAWGQMRFLRERASSRCKNILQKPAWRILRASNRVC